MRLLKKRRIEFEDFNPEDFNLNTTFLECKYGSQFFEYHEHVNGINKETIYKMTEDEQESLYQDYIKTNSFKVGDLKKKSKNGKISYGLFGCNDINFVRKNKNTLQHEKYKKCILTKLSKKYPKVIETLLKRVNLDSMIPSFEKYLITIILSLRRNGLNDDCIYLVMEQLSFPSLNEILNRVISKFTSYGNYIPLIPDNCCLIKFCNIFDSLSKAILNSDKIFKFIKSSTPFFGWVIKYNIELHKILFKGFQNYNCKSGYSKFKTNFEEYERLLSNHFQIWDLKIEEKFAEKFNHIVIKIQYLNKFIALTLISQEFNQVFCEETICLDGQNLEGGKICLVPDYRESSRFGSTIEDKKLTIYNFAEAYGNQYTRFPCESIEFINFYQRRGKVEKLKTYFYNFSKYFEDDLLKYLSEETYLDIDIQPSYILDELTKRKLSQEFTLRRIAQMEQDAEERCSEDEAGPAYEF
jgi:hypothetical protein